MFRPTLALSALLALAACGDTTDPIDDGTPTTGISDDATNPQTGGNDTTSDDDPATTDDATDTGTDPGDDFPWNMPDDLTGEFWVFDAGYNGHYMVDCICLNPEEPNPANHTIRCVGGPPGYEGSLIVPNAAASEFEQDSNQLDCWYLDRLYGCPM